MAPLLNGPMPDVVQLMTSGANYYFSKKCHGYAHYSTLPHIYLHTRRSQLQMKADGFRYDFVCLIGHFEHVSAELRPVVYVGYLVPVYQKFLITV